DGDRGVVVGDMGMILTSSDGGRTWTRRELPDRDRLVWMRDVSLAPRGGGFAVGGNGVDAPIDPHQEGLPGGRPGAPATEEARRRAGGGVAGTPDAAAKADGGVPFLPPPPQGGGVGRGGGAHTVSRLAHLHEARGAARLREHVPAEAPLHSALQPVPQHVRN